MKFEHSGDQYKLVLSNLLMKDQGTYRCRASNSAGEVTNSAKLFVIEEKR